MQNILLATHCQVSGSASESVRDATDVAAFSGGGTQVCYIDWQPQMCYVNKSRRLGIQYFVLLSACVCVCVSGLHRLNLQSALFMFRTDRLFMIN